MGGGAARDGALVALGVGLGACGAAAACALGRRRDRGAGPPPGGGGADGAPPPLPRCDRLSAAQIARYSRQLLLPCFGTAAQLRLRGASALVIGAGGLGSPVIAYLAGAGIGRLGVVDDDTVDASNLHRQVIHGGSAPGLNKALSAGRAVAQLNPDVDYVAYTSRLTAENVGRLVGAYDVVIDASDNLLTRYLVNDACVLQKRPLVSGAAIGAEGRATVYNHTASGGPCYRCLFGSPPPAATVASCSDNGVLGMVPGVMGCIQALEALKILAQMPHASVLAQRMCIYDALAGEFVNVKLRPRAAKCAVCGSAPTIRSVADSEAWCRQQNLMPFEGTAGQCVRPEPAGPELPSTQRITCRELRERTSHAAQSEVPTPWFLLDVREEVQFAICSLPHATNVPLRELDRKLADVVLQAAGRPTYVICRRGVDSVVATQKLVAFAEQSAEGARFFNVDGGLAEWHNRVDSSFPLY